MQQPTQSSNQGTSPQKLISERTLFSVRPTDPPSSPPPISPLPPLPATASPSYSKALRAGSRIPSDDRPVRPPRPQTSLPELKARTITSREIARRQRSSEVAAQVRCPPFPRYILSKISADASRPETEGVQCSTQLLASIPQHVSSFSEEVLSALPQLFQRPSHDCLDNSVNSRLAASATGNRAKAWQVYHKSYTKSAGVPQTRKTDTYRPTTRTALFIPRSPLKHSSKCNADHNLRNNVLAVNQQACYDAQSHAASRSIQHSAQEPPMNAFEPTLMKRPLLISHKRSQAVTSFALPFDSCYAPSGSVSSGTSDDENLTSLPRLLSTSNTLLNNSPALAPPSSHQKYLCINKSLKRNSSEENITFLSLPYSHTLQCAGQPPKTEQDQLKSAKDDATDTIATKEGTNLRHVTLRSTDPEMANEEVPPEFSKEQMRKARRARIMWIVVTVSLVLFATASILGGIVWKLTSIVTT